MFRHIYDLISMSNVMIIFILIARYIFFLPEPNNKKTEHVLYFLWIIFGLIGEFCFSDELVTFLNLVILNCYYVYCSKGNRIRGLFLQLPVMGVFFGFGMVKLASAVFFSADVLAFQGIIWNIVHILLFFLIIAFFVFGKKWRENNRRQMQYRKVGKWEHFLLDSIGMLLFITAMSIEAYINRPTTVNANMYILVISIISVVLSITLVALIFQSNKRAYFNGIAELNERYLNAEIAHFNAYQKTQTETRRIRHDMKNHLLCLEHFLNEGQIEAAKDYLKSIGMTMEQFDTELRTGNTLADAICNEKNRLAQQRGIRFSIEGIFPKDIFIKNVDLCTILTNALDNAIEATEVLEEKEKWIQFKIKAQGNMLFMSFENPTRNNLQVYGRKTTKTDSINHGFGLQNMKLAVERYHGKMDVEIKEAVDGMRFYLNIMLACGE